jgi:hypothetical protein
MTFQTLLMVVCLAGQAWLQQFPVQTRDLSAEGTNPYFPLQAGYQTTFQGVRTGQSVELVITVLHETLTIGGVETRIVDEREWANGELVEVSRNYYAIDVKTHDVYYFGEDVDIYKKGQPVTHDGSWRHGVKGAHFGLMMPGAPAVGMRYYQEQAPDIAMDRAEITSVTDNVTTPAGAFVRCVTTLETSPLEKTTREIKNYAPGLGLVKDGTLRLVSHQIVR